MLGVARLASPRQNRAPKSHVVREDEILCYWSSRLTVASDLCTRNKKVFTHEHELFGDKELEKHMRHGDDKPGAADQTFHVFTAEGAEGQPLAVTTTV